MSLILGMDSGVFLAWILTIFAAILCVFYGIYLEYIKNPDRKKDKKEKPKTEEDKQ